LIVKVLIEKATRFIFKNDLHVRRHVVDLRLIVIPRELPQSIYEKSKYIAVKMIDAFCFISSADYSHVNQVDMLTNLNRFPPFLPRLFLLANSSHDILQAATRT